MDKSIIYKMLPNLMQNIIISLYNYIEYRKRYGGKYKQFLSTFKSNNNLSLEDLKAIQLIKLKEFITNSFTRSDYYKRLAKKKINFKFDSISDIRELQILDKEILRNNINYVYTIRKNKGVVSKTGGTTGKSLEVVFTKKDMQERFAMLDNFRAQFGYKLGKKTAWFSGKELLAMRDVKYNRFWKTDYFHNVRYYSTFHIKNNYLKYYIENLIKYQPEYFVGFPSTIYVIADFGLKHRFKYPSNSLKAIFPTAETVTINMRNKIESFFKTKIYDQYASSEGAPFIFECIKGNLHLELQSGVFEVLNKINRPVKSGRLVVTSFTTHGTPLIRYDIGDNITLADEIEVCNCGNNNPLVKEILGREDDYIYSPQNGKINLGNISNTLKDTKGVVQFQVLQHVLDEVILKVVIDDKIYNKKFELIFLKNWRKRVGDKINIKLDYVPMIEVEKSGKFRMVKNNIKHLIE